MFSLKEKTALITGGGSGIGEAIAHTFARQGASVFILDLNETQARSVSSAIKAAGGKAEARRCDVSNQRQVREVIDAIAAAQPFHILVNNAGVSHIGKAHSTAEADFDRLFSVNVKGVYNCLHACLPHMQAIGGGVVLNLCSIAASVGLPDRFAYSMTKGAVQAMTFSVAKDYLADHIRCNCISPARVHTPFVDGFLAKNYPGQEKEMFERLAKTQPIGRMGTPEEIAALALFLCSDEAAFITGTDYPIDGGFIRLNN